MPYLVYHFRWDNLLAELVNVMGLLHRIASKHFTKKESSSSSRKKVYPFCVANQELRFVKCPFDWLSFVPDQLSIFACFEWAQQMNEQQKKHYCANYINLLSTTVLYDFISVEMFATIRNPSFIIESFFFFISPFIFRQIFCNLLEFKAKNSTHHLRKDGKKGRDKILLLNQQINICDAFFSLSVFSKEISQNWHFENWKCFSILFSQPILCMCFSILISGKQLMSVVWFVGHFHFSK